jgi:radical SAM protein with 4Fe4S-binding SPASM domain
LRPDNHSEVIKQFNRVTVGRFQSHKPKEWFRGWFEQKLLEYYLTNHRPYTCDAGENFFYLDSRGNVYTCNVKGWLMGNLRQSPFKTIWSSKAASSMRKKVASCHDCWMVCTAKTNMKAHLLEIAGEVVGKKMRYTLWPEE